MSSRGGFLSEVSWFQVTASAAAAVTAAWLASSLGVGGTLIGAALGSFVVTISTAFYGRTLDKGKTLIVQTASGTTVEKTVQDGEIAEAFHEVEEAEGSPVLGAEVVEDEPRRLRWKRIIVTALLVLAVSIGAMGAYEVVTQNSFGASTDNPRIGNPFGGGSSSSSDTDDDRKDEDDPDEPEPSSTPTPQRSTATPTPAPSTATPAPAATTPAPTPTPSATVPTPSATPTAPAE
ncbi:MAG: hypothetical protein ABW075_09045 [Aeromicrobium sp.]